MAGFVSGYNKFDVAMAPTTVNAAVTSAYYDMAKYDKVIFIGTCGSMSCTDHIAMSILQAKSSTGSGSVALGVYSSVNGTPTTQGLATKVSEVVISGSSGSGGFSTGDYFTINGITFTCKSTLVDQFSTATFNASRYLYTSTGGSTSPWTAMNHLAAYIADPQYGVPGLKAIVSASSYMTIYANEAHHHPDASISITIGATSTNPSWINKAIGSVECQSAELATSSDFNYVACQSSASAITKFAVTAVRSNARFSPNTTDLMSYDFGV